MLAAVLTSGRGIAVWTLLCDITALFPCLLIARMSHEVYVERSSCVCVCVCVRACVRACVCVCVCVCVFCCATCDLGRSYGFYEITQTTEKTDDILQTNKIARIRRWSSKSDYSSLRDQ